MRHDVKASVRSQPQLAALIGRGRARRRRMALRGLLALPIALMLLAPGATVLAADATTGYSQTTPPPTTTTTTTTTTTPPAPAAKTAPATTTESSPKGGVAPSSTSSTPKSTPTSTSEPAKAATEPTATTAKATTLPFTGLDLRWVILAGVLLVGLGGSILVTQRSRRDTGR
jgi:uncharacterized membrane protein